METSSDNSSIHQYKPEKTNKTFTGEGKVSTEDQNNFSDLNWHGKDKEVYPFVNERKTTAFDVAAYILEKLGEMTTMKLHKLVYYSQAWSLVWDDKPIFSDRIEAWANGPVIRELFAYHRGEYSLSKVVVGSSSVLSLEQKETIDSVLEYYGNKTSQWLIELSHMETPWIKARKGLMPTARGNNEITNESMAEYYGSL